jgi:plasmid maintenance system antidote protein VapI
MTWSKKRKKRGLLDKHNPKHVGMVFLKVFTTHASVQSTKQLEEHLGLFCWRVSRILNEDAEVNHDTAQLG